MSGSRRHIDFTDSKNDQYQERVEYHSNMNNQTPPPRQPHSRASRMHKTRSSKMLLPSQRDHNQGILLI